MDNGSMDCLSFRKFFLYFPAYLKYAVCKKSFYEVYFFVAWYFIIVQQTLPIIIIISWILIPAHQT